MRKNEKQGRNSHYFYIKKLPLLFFSNINIMTHHIVHIKASPKQLAKLRKGHKVRISAAMEGMGINLLIDPEKYSTVSRTFNKGKGMEIQLTPQEIMANQEASPTMEGTGIFGKRFDKFLERNGLRDVAYKVGDIAKPYVKSALLGGIAAGTAGLAGSSLFVSGGTMAPLAAYLPAAGAGAAYLASDYLDHPDKYHDMYSSNAGGTRNANAAASLAGQAAQNYALDKLNKETGSNYGALSTAVIANAAAHKARAEMSNTSVGKQLSQFPDSTINDNPFAPPSRQFSGLGLHRKSRGEIGIHSSFVTSQSHLPPALLSQPFSANFQFQHTLPPAFQKFSKGGGMY